MVPCEDDHVDDRGRKSCELDVRSLKESDRDGNDRCGYGRGGYGRDGYVRGGCDRDGHGREEGDRDVSDCDENDLRGHVRRASAHAHDARARRLSCQ